MRDVRMLPLMVARTLRVCRRLFTVAPGMALVVAAGLALGSAPAGAQEAGTSAVVGRVTAADGGAGLEAVTVRVLGTDRATLTDETGAFRISRLQPGERSFAFEMLGYRSTVETRTLAAGETARLEVALATAPLAVEGLVVTSQKRQQAVIEVPTPVVVLQGDFLEATGIEEFDVLSTYTPGLEVQIQSPNNPGFVVRGITSDEGDARVQPRVSVFQDGVSIAKARGAVVELFDLERVEVLKGPQGTLFGRGAEIGAVHLIQNKARNERSGELTAGPGNYGSLFASGYVNTPIVEDQLFGRVAGVYSRRDGYAENLVGPDLNGKETVALRGLLRYMPSEFTDVDLIVNWQQDTPPGIAFKSGVFPPSGGGSMDPSELMSLGGDPDFEALGVDRTVWGATLLADHVLNPAWTLQGIAAYRTFDSYESFDADGTAASGMQFAEDAAGDQYSLEVRALFNNGGRFSGFGGVNVFHEEAHQGVLVRTNEQIFFPLLTRVFHFQSIDAGGDVFPELPAVRSNGGPNPITELPPIILFLEPFVCPPETPSCLTPLVGAPLAPYYEQRMTNLGRTTAYEAFLDGTLALTERFELTAGIRATVEDMWGGLETPPSETPSVLGYFTGAYPNLVFSPTEGGETVGHEETFTSWVGRLAASYGHSDAMHVYASVARGRRPPVIQEVGTNPVTEFRVLPEEVVWSYEGGVKGFVLAERLQYDVAAFFYDYTDFQTPVPPFVGQQGVIFDTDFGQATAYGGELALTARVAEPLSLFGSYAYIHAEFDEETPEGAEQLLAGNTFRLTPDHSLSAGLGLTGSLAGVDLFLRPSYTWKSRVYFEEQFQEESYRDGVAPGLYQEPYGLLNLRGGADILSGRATVELWANNLLDEDYIIDAGNTGLLVYAPTYIPGPPLMFGARLSVRP